MSTLTTLVEWETLPTNIQSHLESIRNIMTLHTEYDGMQFSITRFDIVIHVQVSDG